MMSLEETQLPLTPEHEELRLGNEIALTRVVVRLLNVARRLNLRGSADLHHYAIYDAMFKSDNRYIRRMFDLIEEHDNQYVDRMQRLVVESGRNSIAFHLTKARHLVAFLEDRIEKRAMKVFVETRETHVRAAIVGYPEAFDLIAASINGDERLVAKNRAATDGELNQIAWDSVLPQLSEVVLDVFVAGVWNFPRFGGRVFARLDLKRVQKILGARKPELRLNEQRFKDLDGPRGVATELVARLTGGTIKLRQAYKRALAPMLPGISAGPTILDDQDDPKSALAYFQTLLKAHGGERVGAFWPSDFADPPENSNVDDDSGLESPEE